MYITRLFTIYLHAVDNFILKSKLVFFPGQGGHVYSYRQVINNKKTFSHIGVCEYLRKNLWMYKDLSTLCIFPTSSEYNIGVKTRFFHTVAFIYGLPSRVNIAFLYASTPG